MLFTLSSRNGFNKTTMQSKSYLICAFLFAGEFSIQGISFYYMCFIYSAPRNSLFKIVVTDNAQCGAYNTWSSANKNQGMQKSVISKILLVQMQCCSSSMFWNQIHAGFKRSLYAHFQQLLEPVKPRKYPPYTIDTSHLFDDDSDPIFVAQSPMPAAGTKS